MTHYKSYKYDSSKRDVVVISLYPALLSLLVSREWEDRDIGQADDETVPSELWTATFRSYAQLILHKFGEELDYSGPALLKRFIEGAQKIHQR